MLSYYALFEPDRKSGYSVSFPDLNHGATQGETIDEAREMAVDLLQSIIGELMKRGDSLPASTKHRGRQYRLISLPALQSAKSGLYLAFRQSGLTKSEFGRRIGVAKANVDRLFDFSHASRLDQIEAAFHALGKRLEVAIHDDAA